jgi:hypothetical protein
MATGVYPPDYATPVGQVRLLIDDEEGEGETYAYSDDQIQAVLALYGNHIKRAAAELLNRIGRSVVMRYGSVTTDDLKVDGGKMAEAFFARARALLEEADADDLEESFLVVYPWGELEKREYLPWGL